MKTAKETLGNWPPTAINYMKAWNSLAQKFEDPYQLEQALVRDIMTIPRAQEETHAALRKIIDTTSNTIRQLEAMMVPVKSWDTMLISVVLFRLPRSTADAWEQRRDVNKKPTLANLLAFLEAKARGRIYTESQTNYGRAKAIISNASTVRIKLEQNLRMGTVGNPSRERRA